MKQLLIVIDNQVDFVTGSLGFPDAVQIQDAICRKIEAYRTAGDEVIYTLDTHGPDYLTTAEGRALPVVHCVRDTPGWQLYGQSAQLLKDARHFEKSAFGCAALLPYLQAGQYDRVELCGLVSNICVLSNAVLAKAALPEAEIVVDAACTACANPEQNREALEVLTNLQVKVLR